MPVVANYRCRECGHVAKDRVFDHTPPATIDWIHGIFTEHGEWRGDCPGRMDRVWSPVHTGRGSSGEPPR